MSEIWKDIPEYEGLYQISNLGRVKTLGRKRVKEGIRKTEIYKGYERINLSKNNKSKHYFIHQYDKNNNLIMTHYSIQQAARNIGRNAGPICRCCQGKQEYAYDYKWLYANESEVM